VDGCPFCGIISGAIKAQVLYDDDKVIAFKDANPQAPVHILVVPKAHLPSLLELGEQDKELPLRLVQVSNRLAKEVGVSKDGFRVVINCKKRGGQTIEHLHLHLLGGRQMIWPPG
jgi:histidine triad (HIT) family protein